MKICLLIAAGSGAPTTFEHAGPVVRIGRDADCELSLQGEASTAVSRQHARIELRAGGATLTDLGSSNGTLLNDKRIQGSARLRVGDRIQLGYTGATLTVRELDLKAPPAGKAIRTQPLLWIGSGAAIALVAILTIVLWPRQPKERDDEYVEGPKTPPPPTQPVEDVEPLTRGEVHEAFAQPISYQPQPSPIVPKQPPDLPDELPPDQKPEGEDVQWLPGYWDWDDEGKNYVWVSGCWRNAPPGRHWVAGAWQEVEGGWMWSAGFWADDETQEVRYVACPPPPDETAPSEPRPQPDAIYVPGSWVWQDTDWAWQVGYWLSPNPGWVWVLPRYVWTPGGYVFVDGYWDYPLEKRGLLLAPMHVHRRSLKDWTFSPRDVVHPDFLLRSLFVGPERRHYHFGDYFGARHSERGFVPFANHRPTPLSHDPLASHYHSYFRDHPTWDRDFRTYAREKPALSHLEKGRQETVTRVAGLAPSVNKAPAFEIKTHHVKPTDRRGEQQIQHNHRVAKLRQQHEAQRLQHGAGPGTVALAPKAAPLHVPPVARPKPVVHAPPRPPAPKVVQRPHPPIVPPRQPRPPRRR